MGVDNFMVFGGIYYTGANARRTAFVFKTHPTAEDALYFVYFSNVSFCF